MTRTYKTLMDLESVCQVFIAKSVVRAAQVIYGILYHLAQNYIV